LNATIWRVVVETVEENGRCELTTRTPLSLIGTITGSYTQNPHNFKAFAIDLDIINDSWMITTGHDE